jgi:hypothetical protein
MALTLTYNADLCIVEITCEGMVSFDELTAEQAPSFALAEEHNTDRFLLDLTNYESSLSHVNILGGVSSYDDKSTRRIRIAVVAPVSEEARKDAQFYETVCVNRGWNARMFAERQEAIDWLVNRRVK